MRCHFAGVKGQGRVRRVQYFLFSVEYRHLAARVKEQHNADQKYTILVEHLLPEVGTEDIRTQTNQPSARVVEPFENDPRENACDTHYRHYRQKTKCMKVFNI